MSPPKRNYVRLTASQWAELRAYWETGDCTLAELSDRYGVSQRAIQSHLGKLGSVKGAKVAEMAEVVRKEVFEKHLEGQDTLISRGKEAREAAYANARKLEMLVMAQLERIEKEPDQVFRAAAAMKMFSLAASTLERTHATKSKALGLDAIDAEEMPVLIIRDLNAEELEKLQRQNDKDPTELDDLGAEALPEDSDEIVVEGEPEPDEIIVEGEPQPDEIVVEGAPEPERSMETCEPPVPMSLSLGGRLVREARS